MELITYPILFIACLVWFFSSWKENRNHAAYLKAKDEAEERTYQMQKAFWEKLEAEGDFAEAARVRNSDWTI